MRSAVVLAGGHGARFGDADEATADLDGEPMIRHVVAGVSDAVDEVVVNCRDDQRAAIEAALSGLDTRFAFDPVPDGGPVAGIRTGCRVARGEWTFVTPCDRPFVPAALPQQLFEAADDDGAVPLVGGRPRPLSAVYDTRAAIEACETTIGLGSPAVSDFVARLSPVTVAEPVSEHAFDEVGTPATLCAPRDRSA
ncbi:molybdenum cofactor guanylyltransferase [Haloarcula salina]|uniref:Molybdenum cofactor guanylyltransferase n=1 Tax=Haloarcula salina TaxID=1429914 RepID=A0AA41G2H3_9EURY|nr:molybdenum cofactor guanylyltransferase [Haloarcula salina]MBV0902249.1 molybdenum cofactor guanylyltransferase [Haloarcula salina]